MHDLLHSMRGLALIALTSSILGVSACASSGGDAGGGALDAHPDAASVDALPRPEAGVRPDASLEDASADAGVSGLDAAARYSKVDLLFMIDNSSTSMAPILDELKRRFQVLASDFAAIASQGLTLDLHLGVVTSDFGAGRSGAPGCERAPGPDRGRLVAVGHEATGCMGPVGSRYVSALYGPSGSTNNLPPGQDLTATFACMSAVVSSGYAGCGYAHQLESVYRALHDDIPENAGFLRANALLVVVFVTRKDDCSASEMAGVFDARMTQYGYSSIYRCARFGIVCGAGGGGLLPYADSMGPLSNCRPAPNAGGAGPGLLFDVSRYTDFFSKPASQGGVKADPRDVILLGVSGPSEPFRVILSNPGTASGMAYAPCPMLDDTRNPPCSPVVERSCQSSAMPAFLGDPAVRTNAVIRSAANQMIWSV